MELRLSGRSWEGLTQSRDDKDRSGGGGGGEDSTEGGTLAGVGGGHGSILRQEEGSQGSCGVTGLLRGDQETGVNWRRDFLPLLDDLGVAGAEPT